ncbi:MULTISPECIES: Mu transposase C-terminal domain-containing protein [unclassified Psychrobacter]|uniref:Mu transposase C-terminal domain-containing protein n=1 Tax=unclassified Psychrobacter TaxID=196806 RepID=UPI001D18D96F|nr:MULTISPECIES: Mu transposase C-terminal domain-containing protein [unclassified Psychrobacter]
MNFELSELPKSRRGLDKYAKSNKWAFVEVPSSGRGGVRREYILPDVLFEQVKLQALSKIAEAAEVNEVALAKATKSELTTTTTPVSKSAATLADWQRDCGIARVAIVRHVLELAALAGKTKAVEGFAKASKEARLDDALTATLKRANAKSGKDGKATVSRRTLFDWVKTFEAAVAIESASAVAELAPKARTTELPEWAGILLKLWADPAKPELAEVMRRLEAALKDSAMTAPSYHQARYFLEHTLGNVERERGRMGSREIKNIKPFVRRDTTVLLPSDVYTADGHTFDAEVAHPETGKPFRPEITTVMDVCTRMVVGYSVDLAESGLAVLDAISSAASSYGIPAIFYVDNGSGYKNAMMKDESTGLMTRMGTEVRHSIAYNSQARGMIERVHQTIWIRLAKKLPTYMGADMDSQARQAVFKRTRKDIKAFGESKSLIGWDMFLQAAAQAVIDYNNEPHSGLPRRQNRTLGRRVNLTPQQMWDEQTAAMNKAGTALVLVSDAERDDLYRPYVQRKCLRGEINLFGNKYFSRELEQYHGETMLVGYDIHDGSKVWVRDMSQRLVCVAEFEANKKGYFAQSAVDDAREKRAIGQVKRAQVHVDNALENMRPQRVLEHVQNQMMPTADIERAQARLNASLAEIEDAQLIEPNVSMQAAFERLNSLNIEDKTQQAQAPITQAQKPKVASSGQSEQDAKFERWLSLDAQVKAGNALEAADTDFYELYPESKIFKIKVREYSDAHEAEHGTRPFFKWG